MRRLSALCAGVLMLAACADKAGSGAAQSPKQDTIIADVAGDFDPRRDLEKAGNVVHFGTDSSALTQQAQTILQLQAAVLLQYPQVTITIEGHADERGTREYNLALGERRAQAMMDYLVALGVNPAQLKTISYGKERPICTEADEACWSKNRRGVSTLDQ